MSALRWVLVDDATLRVGDIVKVLGVKRITAIRPYAGPNHPECIGLADTEPGIGFSLWRGTQTERLEEEGRS